MTDEDKVAERAALEQVRVLAQKIFDTTGIRIDGIRFEWVDVSSTVQRRHIITEVSAGVTLVDGAARLS